MEVFVYRGLSSIPSVDFDCQRIIVRQFLAFRFRNNSIKFDN